MSSTIDQQFIEFIVKSLVGKPDAVKIERRIDEKGVLLELTVDQEDLGRVIGKRGATAQSLRTLLRALGTKNDARYNLKIVDPEGEQRFNQREDNNNEASQQKISEPDTNEAPEYEVSADTGENNESDTSSSDVVNKTRKELEDLDDLDI